MLYFLCKVLKILYLHLSPPVIFFTFLKLIVLTSKLISLLISLYYPSSLNLQVESSEAGDRAWASKSTENLQKIKQDVTRHRYGDDAHLDTTLDALGNNYFQPLQREKMIRID